jgi:hypothetical protein
MLLHLDTKPDPSPSFNDCSQNNRTVPGQANALDHLSNMVSETAAGLMKDHATPATSENAADAINNEHISIISLY